MTRPAGQVSSQHIPRNTQGLVHFLPPQTDLKSSSAQL